jgi:anti-sigma factor RsiW
VSDQTVHSSIEALLPAAALEMLEGEELATVTAHLESCAECTRSLQSYREIVAGIAHDLPEQPFHPSRSARLRARLLARTGRVPAETAARPSRGRSGPGVNRGWAGWAVAAGLAGVLIVHHAVHRPVAYGWLVAGILTLLLAGAAIYLRLQRSRLSGLQQQLSQLLQGERLRHRFGDAGRDRDGDRPGK